MFRDFYRCAGASCLFLTPLAIVACVSSSAAVFVCDLGARHRKKGRCVRRWEVSSYGR
jgi:hypothetical protein